MQKPLASVAQIKSLLASHASGMLVFYFGFLTCFLFYCASSVSCVVNVYLILTCRPTYRLKSWFAGSSDDRSIAGLSSA